MNTLVTYSPQLRFLKHHALYAGIILSCLIFNMIDNEQLVYRRDALADFQLWRVFTAHLCHIDSVHMIMNMLALIVVRLLFTEIKNRDAVVCLLVCAIGVSLGLYFFCPDLIWYVGFSGVLYGALVFNSLQSMTNNRGYLNYLILFGVIAQLVMEFSGIGLSPGHLVFGINVIIESHLFGALSGLIAFLMLKLIKQTRAC